MEYIFTNGTILTMDPGTASPEAVLVRDNLIAEIGNLASCKAAAKKTAKIIDLKSKVLLPAFTDTHTHFVELSKRKVMVDLSSCQSLEDVRGYLLRYRETHAASCSWILGSGWNKNIYPDRQGLTKRFLDQIFPDIPVALQSKDYHSKWCNSLALKIAGLDEASINPFGGIIEKDKNGVPTGILYEKAAELIDPHVVMPDKELLKDAIRRTIEEVYSLGLCGIHSMEPDHSWSLLSEVSNEGSSFRFCWHFPLDDLDSMIQKGVKSYTGDERLKMGGVKIFADGALGSQTAWMFDPFSNSATNTGVMRYTDAQLLEIATKAASHGIAVTIHAIGNRCVHQVLSTIFKINTLYPSSGLMHRIEHVQSIRKQDYSLLQASRAYCALQPVHLSNDIPLIEAYWNNITEQAYPFHDLLQLDIPYGFGSDVPIETINPFLGIYTALERKHALNQYRPSWMPKQKIDLASTLYGYTLGAAQGSCSEAVRGSITKGKLADLMVLEDFFELPNEYWLKAKSLLTMVDGKIVHQV
ncbi:MAG: hypothetical protein CVU48_08890 [Candidatus Cloacimonetes bacterium HGW-Cloacimonetes-1]|jgi:hypothetical protein|nr:MAG: hypothetical protein CVU48_08890 [Candidatus Cloacimonetes bacterium HGW-Cloacimonetes-1]